MTQGVLGQADLTAATLTLLCTIDVTTQTINVGVCNRNAAPIAVQVAIGAGGSAGPEDFKLYNYPVQANGTVEITGVAVSNGEKVWVLSSLANVSADVRGLTVVA